MENTKQIDIIKHHSVLPCHNIFLINEASSLKLNPKTYIKTMPPRTSTVLN